MAAVLVLAAAVGVPLALVGQSSSSQSRASEGTSQVNRQQVGADHGVRGSAAAGPTESVTAHVSDLGALSSINRLRSLIMMVAQDEYSTAAPEKQENQEKLPSANATATTVNGLSKTGRESGTTPAQFERCLSSAMDAAGETRTLRLLATATFKGTPALVYLFGPEPNTSATGNASRSAVVATARGTCKVLATTYF
ncbi:MAG TPA: hypothetical protein VMU64_15170 [Acidimicrobiales bacterium]|nr:hypothetical protein [Acidimicrobiales bacterium]